MEKFTKVQLERYTDFDFLRANGLIIKRIKNSDKICLVHNQHVPMAEKFLEGRRLSEKLNDQRRTSQLYTDKKNMYLP